MKFSYNLIKKLAPGKYGKTALVEKLNLYSFETADIGGDALDISIPPNRYSDAASHIGIAREAAAIFNLQLKDPAEKAAAPDYKDSGKFQASIKDRNLGRRYLAAYADNVRVGPSPKWLKDVLEVCGLRSISNIVDIMNYAMLETGQPLHAFDADKVSGGLVVRRAKKGEKIETIDGQKFTLDDSMLVIADSKKALAIAGIKGGKASEVTSATKRILVESANFDSVNIYRTSRKLGLQTDASARFAHNLSPELAELGMRRALILLKELAAAKLYKPMDVYPQKQPKKVLLFDAAKINQLIGADFKEKEIVGFLDKLGFKKRGKYMDVPPLRIDINGLEDLAEETARLSGYNNLKAEPPRAALGVASEEESVLLKNRIRNLLAGAGFSEAYNYSLVAENETGLAPAAVFGNQEAVKLANPLSKQFAVLRDSLANGLLRNLKDNSRFFDEARIFEIGKIFGKFPRPAAGIPAARGGLGIKNGAKETASLGIILSSKSAVFELKGLADFLFQKLGVVDYFLPDLNIENKLVKTGESLRIETGGHKVLGYLGSLRDFRGGILEINLDRLLEEIGGEREYEPLSKYPSIMRDISILVDNSARVGDILAAIQGISPKLVRDADLIDFYQDEKIGGENKKSLTFRIVFQADDRTLTDAEADREMAIINQVITEKFDAELR